MRLFLFLTLALITPVGAFTAMVTDIHGYRFAMVYFHDDPSFGEEHRYSLHAAVSHDGFRWENLDGVSPPKPVGEWNILRDPSFIQDQQGRFHLVWTTGANGIGYARSSDLKTWHSERYLPVNTGVLEGDNAFTWAPELFYDPESARYLIVFSTATTRFGEGWAGDFKPYYISTSDFETFSPSKRLFDEDAPYYEIDGALLYQAGRYSYFFKIEDADPSTREKEKGGIRVRTAPSLAGPWSPPTETMLPGGLPNSEGPSPVVLPDDSVMVYYDKTGALMAARSKDRDLAVWEDVSDQLVPPPGFRHGTVRELKHPGVSGPNAQLGGVTRQTAHRN